MKTLLVAGTGIKYLSHLTVEVRSAVKTSDCIFYLLNEPAIKKWIYNNNKKSYCLNKLYFSCKKREDAYALIAENILKQFDEWQRIGFLIYGHPLFFSTIVENIIEKIDNSEIAIKILPGISALDCLVADLKFDPGRNGLQTYDATEFILYDHIIDSKSNLVLWQIGVIGCLQILHSNYINFDTQQQAISLLVSKLLDVYSDKHIVYLYVASQYPGVDYWLSEIELGLLKDIEIPRLATLYVPPFLNKKLNSRVYNLFTQGKT